MLLAKFNVSTPGVVFKSAFVAQLDKFNSTFRFLPKGFYLGKHSLIYTLSFLFIQLLKELS